MLSLISWTLLIEETVSLIDCKSICRIKETAMLVYYTMYSKCGLFDSISFKSSIFFVWARGHKNGLCSHMYKLSDLSVLKDFLKNAFKERHSSAHKVKNYVHVLQWAKFLFVAKNNQFLNISHKRCLIFLKKVQLNVQNSWTTICDQFWFLFMCFGNKRFWRGNWIN